ncbi:MAG: hypothetical protein ABJE95_39705 [Byssovorax sp.]
MYHDSDLAFHAERAGIGFIGRMRSAVCLIENFSSAPGEEQVLAEKDPSLLERGLEPAVVAASVDQLIDEPSRPGPLTTRCTRRRLAPCPRGRHDPDPFDARQRRR